jgi:uncharacterized membrane protein
MQYLYKSGRYLFAIAIIAFGIIQLVNMDFMSGLMPVSQKFPARKLFLYVTSILFLFGGIGMIGTTSYKFAARYIGYVLLFLVFVPHLITLLSNIHDPGPWTSIAETAALCGGAFIISGFGKLPARGRKLFALSLLVFAVQHFMYADYIAGLIPAWIPMKVFLAYFVGVAFTFASISILIHIKTRLACTLLGFMFLFWLIFLHGVLVANHLHTEPQWTSFFVAFGFCGIFFLIAGLSSRNLLRKIFNLSV